jgi:hypothetical protein
MTEQTLAYMAEPFDQILLTLPKSLNCLKKIVMEQLTRRNPFVAVFPVKQLKNKLSFIQGNRPH